jgi:hypothetical protein
MKNSKEQFKFCSIKTERNPLNDESQTFLHYYIRPGFLKKCCNEVAGIRACSNCCIDHPFRDDRSKCTFGSSMNRRSSCQMDFYSLLFK